MLLKYLKSIALFSSFLFIFEKAESKDIITHIYKTPANEVSPWFTGSLLSPSAQTTPAKHGTIESYFGFFAFTGLYTKNWATKTFPNFYSTNLYISTSYGLTSFLDIGATLNVSYQFTQGQQSTQFGDIPFGIGIQLLTEDQNSWLPSIKLGLRATAPTGKYNNLNPNKLQTDSVGYGTWAPRSCLTVGKLLKLNSIHFLSYRVSFNYTVPTPVNAKNFTFYGGVPGTRGTIYLGNTFWTDLALEYNFNQKWAFALDLYYQHFNKNRFSGKTGFIAPGIPASLTYPSIDAFSLAPALEYNWSANVGLIGGVWFSVAGRNSARFLAGSLAINIYI